MPRPPASPTHAEDYIAVPYTPRPPLVEIVPPRPAKAGDLVWADGGWEWSGERYQWQPGAWVALPSGATRARWVVVRRDVDGQLFFAPSKWVDASGKAMRAPRALARALQRAGGAASAIGGGDEPSAGSAAESAAPETIPNAQRNTAPAAPARAPGMDE